MRNRLCDAYSWRIEGPRCLGHTSPSEYFWSAPVVHERCLPRVTRVSVREFECGSVQNLDSPAEFSEWMEIVRVTTGVQ